MKTKHPRRSLVYPARAVAATAIFATLASAQNSNRFILTFDRDQAAAQGRSIQSLEVGRDSVTDAGNVYFSGIYHSQIDGIIGGADLSSGDGVTRTGSSYIAKMGPSGGYLWIKQMEEVLGVDARAVVTQIVPGRTGVYVGGWIQPWNETNTGYYGLVAKLDFLGNLLWQKTLPASSTSNVKAIVAHQDASDRETVAAAGHFYNRTFRPGDWIGP